MFSLSEYREEIALAAKNFIDQHIHSSSTYLLTLIRTSGQPLSSINQATSPLPSLSRELADKRRQFHGDCGVVLFRGLDPDKLTRLENVICRYLYWLVFSHVWKERISSWWKDLRCWL